MPWYEHCKWSCAQKYILKCIIFLFYDLFCILTPCSTHNIHFREPVQHWTHIRRSRVDGSVGSYSYTTYVCFKILPGSISVFPYLFCLQIKGFEQMFVHLLAKCLNVTYGCLWFGRSSQRDVDCKNVRSDRVMETFFLSTFSAVRW